MRLLFLGAATGTPVPDGKRYPRHSSQFVSGRKCYLHVPNVCCAADVDRNRYGLNVSMLGCAHEIEGLLLPDDSTIRPSNDASATDRRNGFCQRHHGPGREIPVGLFVPVYRHCSDYAVKRPFRDGDAELFHKISAAGICEALGIERAIQEFPFESSCVNVEPEEYIDLVARIPSDTRTTSVETSRANPDPSGSRNGRRKRESPECEDSLVGSKPFLLEIAKDAKAPAHSHPWATCLARINCELRSPISTSKMDSLSNLPA